MTMRDFSTRSGFSPLAWTALAALTLLWAGMVIGVSGLATPVKFAAPSLSLPVALEVGRITFHVFTRVEWGLGLTLLLLAPWLGRRRLLLAPIAAIVAIMLLQTFYLLPQLNLRVAAIIAGQTPPPSSLHSWYTVAEAGKLAALLLLGIAALRQRP